MVDFERKIWKAHGEEQQKGYVQQTGEFEKRNQKVGAERKTCLI